MTNRREFITLLGGAARGLGLVGILVTSASSGRR